MERGVTQGNLFSSTIFNIMVDVVIRTVLLEVCGPQGAHHGLGWVEGEHNIVLYVNDGQKVGHNPIWVQTTLTVVVRMFKRVGLLNIVGNIKAMVCTQGFIWRQHGTVKYKMRAMGEGATF